MNKADMMIILAAARCSYSGYVPMEADLANLATFVDGVLASYGDSSNYAAPVEGA